MYRSTKGASKARRDQINAEIRHLKDLLPITDTDKARLSYLHIMSLACMYTRKSLFFSQDTSPDQSSGFMSFHELSELIHELAGFMVVVTGEGKLLYLSENVVDHLGLCMVDLVSQSDSVYDIVDPSDHFVMRSSLAPSVTGDADRLFRCHFNTSKFIRRQGSGNKTMLVRARCLPPPGPGFSQSASTPVWVCFCTPLRSKHSAHTTPGPPPPLTPPPDHSFLLASFHTQHLRDMTVWDAQDSVTMYLGYNVEALRSRSWYSLLHPRDLSHATAQHCTLLSERGDKQVEMVVQVETADHSWVWLYMVLQMGGGEHPITCNNYVISESEAWSLRQQLNVEQQSHCSVYYSSGDCMHRHSSLSSPDQVFTPSSSGLSAQSFDFTTAPSGSGFSDEATQPAEQQPRSSLSSLEEESLTRGRQQWYSERSGSAPISPPASLTESDFLNQRVPSHSVGLSEPVSPSLSEYLTPVSMPLSHPMGEFACTPPYTPQLSRGFSFGERLHLSLDSTNTVASSCQKLHAFAGTERTHGFSRSFSSEEATLMLPREYHRKVTSDDFREAECNTMGVSEIQGSLFVDVTQKPMNSPLNGLLTPEISPTQHSGSFLFSSAIEQEREQEEISTLARYLSSLAESFSCSSLFPKQPLSTLPSSPPPKPQSHDSFSESKCPPWTATEQPHQRDVSLYEESALLEILYEDLASFPSSPSSYSTASASSSTSSSPSPQTTTSRDYSIGVDHFSSVQSTQCNCMAVGGATMAAGAATMTTMQETAEDVLMDTSESPPSASLAATQAPASVLGHPAPPHTVPHAQFLMEELVAMDQVFEADASISSFWGNSLSCINSQSTTLASRSFHQGGSLRDPAF